MRLVAYTRVSTREQAEEGYSLSAQRYRLEAWCLALGHELVHVYEDAGCTGSNMNRPGFQAALAALRGGQADGLVVTKLDRLTRSVKDFNVLVDDYFTKKWHLASLGDSIDTNTASGRLVLNVLLSVFQWERESIAERTREGLAQARREGKRLGRPAGPVDARIAVMHRAGLSMNAIGRELVCTATKVRRMLARES